MLHGIEHLRTNRTRAPSPVFNLPNVAALGVGFGAVGYPLATRTTLPAWGILLLALTGGALAISGMIVLLAKWALRGRKAQSQLEAEDIQGQLAVVTSEITSDRTGRISYGEAGVETEYDARSIGSHRLPVGTEVVIDHIEDGIAIVEEWAVVEARL